MGYENKRRQIPSDQRIVIDGEKEEHVEEFKFLGRVVPNSAKVKSSKSSYILDQADATNPWVF